MRPFESGEWQVTLGRRRSEIGRVALCSDVPVEATKREDEGKRSTLISMRHPVASPAAEQILCSSHADVGWPGGAQLVTYYHGNAI